MSALKKKANETVARPVPDDNDPVAVRRELVELIDRDMQRRGVDVYDPSPKARVGVVLGDLLPITGNVLIPLRKTISRFGVFIRLLKPGL